MLILCLYNPHSTENVGQIGAPTCCLIDVINAEIKGNHIFNATVYNKSSFFDKLFKPTVKNLNLSDSRIGWRHMVMSIKAQINSLKLGMKRHYLMFINVTLYKEVLQNAPVHQFLGLS